MTMRVNRQAYRRMIEENIAAIEASNCQRLEATHSRLVMLESVEMHYEVLPSVMRLLRRLGNTDLPAELEDEVKSVQAKIKHSVGLG